MRYKLWGSAGHFAFPWVLLVLAVAVAVLAIVAVIVIARRKKSEGGGARSLSQSQRGTLEEFDAQVSSLLSQHGGELTQTEIANALGLPFNIVASRLLEMERTGEVQRRWSVDPYTYTVRARAT